MKNLFKTYLIYFNFISKTILDEYNLNYKLYSITKLAFSILLALLPSLIIMILMMVIIIPYYYIIYNYHRNKFIKKFKVNNTINSILNNNIFTNDYYLIDINNQITLNKIYVFFTQFKNIENNNFSIYDSINNYTIFYPTNCIEINDEFFKKTPLISFKYKLVSSEEYLIYNRLNKIQNLKKRTFN